MDAGLQSRLKVLEDAICTSHGESRCRVFICASCSAQTDTLFYFYKYRCYSESCSLILDYLLRPLLLLVTAGPHLRGTYHQLLPRETACCSINPGHRLSDRTWTRNAEVHDCEGLRRESIDIKATTSHPPTLPTPSHSCRNVTWRQQLLHPLVVPQQPPPSVPSHQ